MAGNYEKDIPKGNGKDFLRVTVSEYEGHRLLGIRYWFMPEGDDRAELRPTQKGISIPVKLYKELLSALEEAKEYID